MTDAAAWIEAVRSSHDRLARTLGPLSAAEVEQRSYATDWSVADVASHLGSQAEIFALVLDAGLDGAPAPGQDDFTRIWDRWNALPPAEQVRQSLAGDEAFVTRVEQLPADARDRFAVAMFGRELDLAGMLAMRLGEHALHTWDIAVALDTAAPVGVEAVGLLVDELPATAARAGQAAAGVDLVDPVEIVTTDPVRTFVLEAGDPVTLRPGAAAAGPDPLVLPAEALIRLVHGRLDPDHTPTGADEERLAALRRVFPGY